MSCSSNKNWIVLFDGKTVEGLRGYKQSGFPKDSWAVVDGALKSIPENGIDLIGNRAGMTREYSRICLKVMLSLKPPSKSNFGPRTDVSMFPPL